MWHIRLCGFGHNSDRSSHFRMNIELNWIEWHRHGCECVCGCDCKCKLEIFHFDVVNASIAAASQVSNFIHKRSDIICVSVLLLYTVRYARVRIVNRKPFQFSLKIKRNRSGYSYKHIDMSIILWWWHISNYLWSMDRCWKVYTVLKLCKLFPYAHTWCCMNYAVLRDIGRDISNHFCTQCVFFLLFNRPPYEHFFTLYIDDKNVTKYNFLPNTYTHFTHSLDFIRLCYKHL